MDKYLIHLAFDPGEGEDAIVLVPFGPYGPLIQNSTIVPVAGIDPATLVLISGPEANPVPIPVPVPNGPPTPPPVAPPYDPKGGVCVYVWACN